MKFNFKPFVRELGRYSGVPFVTIGRYANECRFAYFSQGAFELLGKPKRIMLGFDEENRCVGFMPT